MQESEMKLCFGVFVKILICCCSLNVTNKKLVNELTKMFIPSYECSDTQVSRLLKCAINMDSQIIENAQAATPADIYPKFHDAIVPLLDEDKKAIAILALLDAIKKDKELDSIKKESFKKYFGATKDALLQRSEFVLHEFLAAAFLYATTCVKNRSGEGCIELIDDSYIGSLYAKKNKIRLVSAPESQSEHPKIPAAANTHVMHTDSTSKQIFSIFNDAVKKFHIIDYIYSDPAEALPKRLVEYVIGFLSAIKQSIIIGLIEYQKEVAYQKVKKFSDALASYQSYLAENLYPKTDVFALTGTEDAQYIVDFKKTVDDYKQKINSIYGEINNGNTLFVL